MSNLFEQFQGADLDRLAECIKAVRLAGLNIDQYTQAGVNEHSGNVWVSNEDWAGCVYCSIGFDVQWLHFCFDCGSEYDFDTYQELVDYADKHHGHCEACIDEEVSA
jgi:hypothetical protein